MDFAAARYVHKILPERIFDYHRDNQKSNNKRSNSSGDLLGHIAQKWSKIEKMGDFALLFYRHAFLPLLLMGPWGHSLVARVSTERQQLDEIFHIKTDNIRRHAVTAT